MPDFIREVVQEFANSMKMLFGAKLSRVVVYGSYARMHQSRFQTTILLEVIVTLCSYHQKEHVLVIIRFGV